MGLVEEHNPNRKGNVAELAIATEAASLGLSVLKPLTEHEVYDLALDLGIEFGGFSANGQRSTGRLSMCTSVVAGAVGVATSGRPMKRETSMHWPPTVKSFTGVTFCRRRWS